MKSKSLVKFLLKSFIFIATFFLALELVLQIAAFVVWRKARPVDVQLQTNEKVILCVGDSYTYGMGSSSIEKSYPGQLQNILGKGTKVINRGWPGQNSADVAEHIKGMLVEYKPSIVFILVGENDRWSQPRLFSYSKQNDDTSSFPWRWRTRRLFKLVTSANLFSRWKHGVNFSGSDCGQLMKEAWTAISKGDLNRAESFFKKCDDDNFVARHF